MYHTKQDTIADSVELQLTIGEGLTYSCELIIVTKYAKLGYRLKEYIH